MRRASYSGNVAKPVNWGGMFRVVLMLLVVAAGLWWLATGPAFAWLQSAVDWLLDL